MQAVSNRGRNLRPLILATILATTLGLCILPATLRAQEPNLHLKGSIDSYHAVGTERDGKWMASHTRVRGDLKAEGYGATARAIANLEYNPIYEPKPQINLREAYLDYTATHWGIRGGRQIILLGVADGLQVLDQLSPTDMREFLTRDYDDIRQGVNALRLSYYRSWLTLDLIAIPTFESSKLPLDEDSPWTMRPDTKGLPLIVEEGDTPALRIQNTELCLRARFNLPGIDFSLVAIRGWDKMPLMCSSLTPEGILIQLDHPQMYTFGASMAIPIGQTVLTAEGAFIPNRSTASDLGIAPQEKHCAMGLLGLSWYAPSQWFLSAQAMYRHTFGYDDTLFQERAWLSQITLNLSKKLIGETLHLGLNAHYDIGDKGLFSRFSAKYLLLDELHLSAGYDLFIADEGMLATYRDNDEAWFRLQYFF